MSKDQFLLGLCLMTAEAEKAQDRKKATLRAEMSQRRRARVARYHARQKALRAQDEADVAQAVQGHAAATFLSQAAFAPAHDYED